MDKIYTYTDGIDDDFHMEAHAVMYVYDLYIYVYLHMYICIYIYT